MFMSKQECYFYGAVLVGYADELDLFKGLIEIWRLSQEMIHSAIHLRCPPPPFSVTSWIYFTLILIPLSRKVYPTSGISSQKYASD